MAVMIVTKISKPSRASALVVLVLLFLLPSAVNAQEVPLLGVHEIQGAGHVSPWDRETVRTRGIVVATTARGFYLMSDEPDDDPATSEGIYVETIRRPSVEPGQLVELEGRIGEDYPGGRSSGNLPITTLKRPDVTVIASNRPIPAPTIIGTGGRIPPGEIISNDADGNAIDSPFDPAEDGLDFYESLEGMLVQVNDAVSVGTIHTSYGEIWVVPDRGAHAGIRTPRGGIVVRENDFNPDRVLIDYLEEEIIHFQRDVPLPVVGDRFLGPVVGIVSYSYYNYKLILLDELPRVEPAGLEREVARPVDVVAGEVGVEPDALLSVAAFNVENLSARSDPAKLRDIAETIVMGLQTPDLVLLSEIQDGDGTTRSDITSAERTAEALIDALNEAARSLPAAARPDYRYVDIAPEYNRSGGAPNANIRPGFLYRADRLELVPGSLELVSPDERAFVNARKPVAARFRFRGETILAVANHFSSKGGDSGLFGRNQPPTLGSEPQRILQGEAVNAYVTSVLAEDPDALVVVGGDLNDFHFSPPLRALEGDVLHNLANDLPAEEIYSYIYEGNSQVLDHILVSEALRNRVAEPVDYVHRYAEFLYEERFSDHDPVLARFVFD
jgi:predicted extracellular nuclease